ncbi:hypothetical protein [Tsukamurella sp. 8J]|uniref:hypothetical protein n=1 Tax=Tsukamurella sp. 8J TaxID=3031962 RepID=UPI0023B96271|nr:hypothetical protein [Tsukamurella sp. 8J]MDF0531256.1 hypothetical protein [Tsukamurella sp. 8J]
MATVVTDRRQNSRPILPRPSPEDAEFAEAAAAAAAAAASLVLLLADVPVALPAGKCDPPLSIEPTGLVAADLLSLVAADVVEPACEPAAAFDPGEDDDVLLDADDEAALLDARLAEPVDPFDLAVLFDEPLSPALRAGADLGAARFTSLEDDPCARDADEPGFDEFDLAPLPVAPCDEPDARLWEPADELDAPAAPVPPPAPLVPLLCRGPAAAGLSGSRPPVGIPPA